MTNLLAKTMREMQKVAEQSGRTVTMSASSCEAVADRLERLDMIERMAACGTVDSFLAQTDEQKRLWFALAFDESSRRKAAEQLVEEMRIELSVLRSADPTSDAP